MYVDKLSQAQQEEYLREVVLGSDFDDKEISGISCDMISDENAKNQMFNLAFSVEDRYNDATPKQYDQEVLDFSTDLGHLHFMISKFGIDYLSALRAYSKTLEAKGVYNGLIFSKCQRFLEQTMCEDRQVVGLDTFLGKGAENLKKSSVDKTEMERQ